MAQVKKSPKYCERSREPRLDDVVNGSIRILGLCLGTYDGPVNFVRGHKRRDLWTLQISHDMGKRSIWGAFASEPTEAQARACTHVWLVTCQRFWACLCVHAHISRTETLHEL